LLVLKILQLLIIMFVDNYKRKQIIVRILIIINNLYLFIIITVCLFLNCGIIFLLFVDTNEICVLVVRRSGASVKQGTAPSYLLVADERYYYVFFIIAAVF
jgi:hypothetical protein